MTGAFARVQDAFQRAIVDGDDAVLADMLEGPRAPRAAMLDVYRQAFPLRLVEALRGDFVQLHSYLGDQAFDRLGRAYVAAHPSRNASVRWFGEELADFLARTPPWRGRPELAEIARLEIALGAAFDGPDRTPIGAADLAGVPPELWGLMLFEPHPTVSRLDLVTNAFGIWSALSSGGALPEAARAQEPERLIVWRLAGTPLVRPMAAEEAMMWDEAARGVPFGVLCTMLATVDHAAAAPARAAGHLSGWISSGLLAGFTIGG